MIGAGLLLATGQAFADDPPPAGSGEFGSTSSGGNVTATAAAGFGWSPQIIDNDLVLPKSALGVYGSLGVVSYSYVEAPVPPATMGATVYKEAGALQVGAGYGVTEKITVGGEYTVPFYDGSKAFPYAGDFIAYGGYGVLHDAKMALAVGGGLAFREIGGPGHFEAIQLGASFRYNLVPTVCVFTGNPIAPGPIGQQLVIGLTGGANVTFAIPVGVGWQPMPKLFGWLETTLVTFASNTRVIGADSTPVQIGALYRATHDLDLGGFILDDFNHADGSLALGVLARWYKL
jgi:hypothetical protein